MIHFSIAERLRPFSHLPGVSMLLPGSRLLVQFFPCLLRFYDLEKSAPRLLTELHFNFSGPVKQFTVCSDLEKGCLTLSGMAAEGWVRFHLISGADGASARLILERSPPEGVCITVNGEQHVLQRKETLDLFVKVGAPFIPYVIPPCERLSLGCHKAQEWEMIKRRLSLEEIFPFIHRLGQLVPSFSAPKQSEGTGALLEECRRSIADERPDKGEEKWRRFILGAFSSLLVPRWEDDEHQGLILKAAAVSEEISPLVLLSEASRLIRELFVRQNKQELWILPHLLPSLHCGRLLDVHLEGGGRLSIEWTKKTIRRLVLHAEQEGEVKLYFRSHVRSYRLRQHEKDQGERLESSTPKHKKKNHSYFLDNFQD